MGPPERAGGLGHVSSHLDLPSLGMNMKEVRRERAALMHALRLLGSALLKHATQAHVLSGHATKPVLRRCCLLLQYSLFQSCSRGGRVVISGAFLKNLFHDHIIQKKILYPAK